MSTRSGPRAVAIDIETVPLLASLAEPFEPGEPPYKTDEANARWLAKAQEKHAEGLVKRCSLSPRLGRVVAVGLHDHGGNATLLAKTEADEPALLRAVWIACVSADTLVTFNGHQFDIPFLFVRSAIHGIVPSYTASALLRRYTLEPHFDCRMVLSNWDMRAEGTLDDWCDAFGVAKAATALATGADVWPAVQRGAWSELLEYVTDDARRTLALHERLAAVWGAR